MDDVNHSRRSIEVLVTPLSSSSSDDDDDESSSLLALREVSHSPVRCCCVSVAASFFQEVVGVESMQERDQNVECRCAGRAILFSAASSA